MTTEGLDGSGSGYHEHGPQPSAAKHSVADTWVPTRLDIHALMLMTDCGRHAAAARARSRRYARPLA